MRAVWHAALLPVMRAWVMSSEPDARTVPIPVDSPHVRVPGRDSDRVLLLGSGPAMSWGVLSHQLGLAGGLARSLAKQTGRGADVDVVADASMTADSAIEQVERLGLWRYDAVVVTVGTNDALELTPLSRWRESAGVLVDAIVAASAHGTHVFFVGIQPIRTIPLYDSALGSIAARHARAMNRVTAELCAANDRATFVPLPASERDPDGRHRSKAGYDRWGSHLAEWMRERMPAGHTVRRVEGLDERAEERRQAAVDALRMAAVDSAARIDRIVDAARRLFGSESAAFSIVDRDAVWGQSLAGEIPPSTPRVGSFSAETIAHDDGIVIADTWQDDRFKTNYMVTGPPFVRFYTGYPVLSPSGEKVGALCVFGRKPRDPASVDAGMLRPFARMIETELAQGLGE